jgi:hypothetical protein
VQSSADVRIAIESGYSAERVQELNCERAVTYRIVLSDKLVQTLAVDDTVAVRIGAE